MGLNKYWTPIREQIQLCLDASEEVRKLRNLKRRQKRIRNDLRVRRNILRRHSQRYRNIANNGEDGVMMRLQYETLYQTTMFDIQQLTNRIQLREARYELICLRQIPADDHYEEAYNALRALCNQYNAEHNHNITVLVMTHDVNVIRAMHEWGGFLLRFRCGRSARGRILQHLVREMEILFNGVLHMVPGGNYWMDENGHFTLERSRTLRLRIK